MAALSTNYLTNVKQRAEVLYREDFESLAIDAPVVETAKAVLDNGRAARAQALLQASPTDNVDVVWNSPDNFAVQDCTDDCSLTGVPLSGNVLNISAPQCKEIVISITEEDARREGRSWQEQESFVIAQAMAELDTFVNSFALARLKALADTAVTGTLPAYATQTAGVVNIPAANYNLQMWADLKRTAARNRMGRPYFIDNGELGVFVDNALISSGNLDGKGDAARVAAMRMYFDLLGFFEAGLTEDTFVIKPGSVAMFHKHYYTPVPREIGGKVQQVRTAVESASIGRGLMYDWTAEETCLAITGNASHSNIAHTHKLKVNLGVFKAPGVGGTRPGILLLNRA